MLGVSYDTVAVDVDEDLDVPLASDPAALAGLLAERKARAARALDTPDRWVLGFDTLVVHEGEVLGKPKDAEDAVRMLRSLSDRDHEVVTGLAVWGPASADPLVTAESTPVRMRRLSEDDIARWLDEGELMGCAGAYNIERHLASVELDECFQNVAGLPLCRLYAIMASGELGEPPAGLTPPYRACDEARGVECVLGPRVSAAPRRQPTDGA